MRLERNAEEADTLRRTAAAGWKDSDVAFSEAIATGRLSTDPASPVYAGHFMYMGPGKGGDAFKHIVTRAYIA